MSESEQQRTTEVEQANTENGSVLRETTTVSNSDSVDAGFKSMQIVWLIVGIIETLLAIRFILRLLGANPGSGFVDVIYTISGFFAAPFEGIFSNAINDGAETRSVFEPAILVAMIVYALLGWGISKVIRVATEK